MEPRHPPTAQANERPTRIRFVILTYLCSLTFILYLDRVCISQASHAIRKDLNLDLAQMGDVFAAFTLAYGLFMAAAGQLGDRFGPRRVLVAIVLWWSICTALTGAATGLWMLLLVRFVFGAGEAGALPNCARILSRWFPLQSRGLPQGLLNTAALTGSAVAPSAAAYLMQLLDEHISPYVQLHFGFALVGWRWTFVIFGLLGLAWGAAFWYSYRDDPAAHPRVNQMERDFIAKGRADEPVADSRPRVPWRRVLSSRNVWLMGLICTCASFASYLYMFWFPDYLQLARTVNPLDSGKLSSIVLAGGAVGSAAGGFLIDYAMRKSGGNRRRRSIIGAASMALAALALYCSLGCDNAVWASVLTSLAFYFSMMQIASWWGVIGDISGAHVAALFGLMNSMGIVGGIGAQMSIGRIAKFRGSLGFTGRDQWDPGLYVCVAVLVLGALAWLFVDSNKSAVN